MKFGFFGGGIILVLTLVFSYIAIQNNKIAKEITLKSFNLDKPVASTTTSVNIAPVVVDANKTNEKPIAAIADDSNKTEVKEDTPINNDKWKKFDEKFEGFDKKFENF